MTREELLSKYAEGERNFTGVNLENADLREVDFEGVNLQKANLKNADLREADLEGVNLQKVNLQRSDLRLTNLRETNLWMADLHKADLRGADLTNADLEGADLEGTDLRGADLRGADLRGTDLTNASLEGTGLTGTNLKNANVKNTKLQKDDTPLSKPVSKEYNSDLSKCEVGDMVASIKHGWLKVLGSFGFVVSLECKDDDDTLVVQKSGKFHKDDKAPSYFSIPPQWLFDIIGPKPKPEKIFTEGQRVLVWEEEDDKSRRIYAYKKDGEHYVYNDSGDKWTSYGEVAMEK